MTKTKAHAGTHSSFFRIKLSNEFKFPIAAFHHASEAYLVPDLLKQTYGESATSIECVILDLTSIFTRSHARHCVIRNQQSIQA